MVAPMQTLRWQVGDATVLRVAELDAAAALDGLIPGLDPADLTRTSWLTPHFVDEAGRLKGLVQVFVVLIAGRVIVVDPGVGNDKARTAVPGWADLHTDFLDRLASAGVQPDAVDLVLNTHLHFDHVGWHTRFAGGAWQPTFPAARHVMVEGEFAYWHSTPPGELADQLAGFADSVRPVYDARLVDLVADDHVVCAGVRLVPTPGHTPHHVSVLIESAGRSAVITGDVLHHPGQLAYPQCGPADEFDPDRARASRTALLERYADTETIVIGSHFADPVAGHVRPDGAGFQLVPTQPTFT
jgi:glyoxylase-like metal-dependent hydrolase (beta-lactamase superfamily II)